MITLPYNVRVGVNGGTKSLVFQTIPEVVKFLTSEESDYMYSESQMDVAVFASMLNIRIHIFQYNRVDGGRDGWTQVIMYFFGKYFFWELVGLLENNKSCPNILHTEYHSTS